MGSSRVGKQSADVCLHSPFHQPGPGLVLTAPCRPGWGRSWEGQRHLGVPWCCWPGTASPVPPAVAPLAGCWWSSLCWQLAGWWQAAAGILRPHRFFTGSCFPADPSASLLLSVLSFAFLLFLPLKQSSCCF